MTVATQTRQIVAAIVVERETPAFAGRCIYCAARCHGRACGSHKDLLLIEQEMARGYRSAA